MSYSLRVLAVASVVGMIAIHADAASTSYVGASQKFTVAKTTAIPGATLEAGDYTIQVLDQLSDRMLVRVDNRDGKKHSLFLAVPHAKFENTSLAGPADWRVSSGEKATLRGFAFSNGSTIEFVYPKAEAAAIATKNAEKVIAIDPESEGKPVLKKMSRDDMKIVTMWMLSLTTASPNSKTPALLAQRYETDADASGTLLAQNTPPSAPSERAVPVRSQSQAQVPNEPAATLGAANTDVVTRERTPHHVVKQLPHTASTLPLLWLAGFFSLLLAATAHFGRIWIR